jgi:hypothetical protein
MSQAAVLDLESLLLGVEPRILVNRNTGTRQRSVKMRVVGEEGQITRRERRGVSELVNERKTASRDCSTRESSLSIITEKDLERNIRKLSEVSRTARVNVNKVTRIREPVTEGAEYAK